MSVFVVKDVSTTHARFSGNVESVDTQKAEVCDKSDLQALENQLTIRINGLQDSINRLSSLLSEVAKTANSMPSKVREEVASVVASQKSALTVEYKKIIHDMSQKCAKITSVINE